MQGSITRAKKCNFRSILECVELASGTKPYDCTSALATSRESEKKDSRCQYEGGQLWRRGNSKIISSFSMSIYIYNVHSVDIVVRRRQKAIVFVNVRRCICVDVVYIASYRACKICRCVFNMSCSETCECLSQTSFREFVVATVATPGTTADLHGSSVAHELGCPFRLSSFRRGRVPSYFRS